MKTPLTVTAFLLLLGSALVFTGVKGEERDQEGLSEQHTAILQQLRDRFEETGSFRAQYATLSHSGEREVEILYDARNGYAMVHLGPAHGEQEATWMVSHFARDQGNGSYTMQVIDGRKGEELRFSIDELRRAIVSPVQSAGTVMALLVGEEQDRETITAVPHIQEGLGLETGKDGVTASTRFGVQSSPPDGFDASWFEEDLFLKASTIEIADAEVELEFETGRRVRIDRNTGLLISDVFPDPDDRSTTTRFIKLNESTVLGENSVPEEWRPDFSAVNFEQIDAQSLLAQFEEEFTAEVFRKLTEYWLERVRSPSEVRRILQERGMEIRNAVRDEGYRFGRDYAGLAIEDDVIESIVESTFVPMYERLGEQEPDAGRPGFSDFLDTLAAETANDPGFLEIPAATNQIKAIRVRDEKMLARAPLEIWELLEILHEEVSPDFIDGLRSGVLHSIIERAKKSDAATRAG